MLSGQAGKSLDYGRLYSYHNLSSGRELPAHELNNCDEKMGFYRQEDPDSAWAPVVAAYINEHLTMAREPRWTTT